MIDRRLASYRMQVPVRAITARPSARFARSRPETYGARQ